jgi:RPA family protein
VADEYQTLTVGAQSLVVAAGTVEVASVIARYQHSEEAWAACSEKTHVVDPSAHFVLYAREVFPEDNRPSQTVAVGIVAAGAASEEWEFALEFVL